MKLINSPADPSSLIQSWGVPALFALLVVSLIPKWSTLHLAGVLLLFTLLTMRKSDLHMRSVRAYLLIGFAVLGPILITGMIQTIIGMDTAPSMLDLFVMLLRIVGIGLVIVFALERGWLTLKIAAYILVLGIGIYAFSTLYYMWDDPRFNSLSWRNYRIRYWGNPNVFGFYMAILSVGVLGLLRYHYKHFGLWAIGAAGLLCVFSTGSRGALLALLVGIMFLFLTYNWKNMMAVAIALSAFVFGLLKSGLWASLGSSSSDAQRLANLEFSWEAFKASPWWGWGIDSFADIPGHQGNSFPHNVWADAALSGGVFAVLLLFATFAFLSFRLLQTQTRSSQLILALLVTYLISATFEGSFYTHTEWRNIGVLILAFGTYVVWRQESVSESAGLKDRREIVHATRT